MRADAPLREMNALLRDAKTVSERNKYPPYFFASAEIQMEASERVSRTILAEGIKEWGMPKAAYPLEVGVFKTTSGYFSRRNSVNLRISPCRARSNRSFSAGVRIAVAAASYGEFPVSIRQEPSYTVCVHEEADIIPNIGMWPIKFVKEILHAVCLTKRLFAPR